MWRMEWHKPSGIRLTAAYAALGLAILVALVHLAVAISIETHVRGDWETVPQWIVFGLLLAPALAQGALLVAWFAADGALPGTQQHRLKLALVVALGFYGVVTFLGVLVRWAVQLGAWVLLGGR